MMGFASTTEFVDDILSYKYGNAHHSIYLTPQGVRSKQFLEDYMNNAQKYRIFNIKSNVGNSQYKKSTNVAPYSLQKLVTDTYKMY